MTIWKGSILRLIAALCIALSANAHTADKVNNVDNANKAEKTTSNTTYADIVVTATRVEQPADTTAASITVITKKQIEERQFRTAVEALRSVPGLTLATNGTPGQTTGVFMRGTKTSGTQVLIDGRRLPSGLAGDFSLQDLSLDNVERIEVVRGPLSAIQGGASLGGTINLITKDGRGLARPESFASFEAGSFQTCRETAGSRGAFGPFDYSIEGSRLDTSNQRDNNEYRATSGNVKLGVQATRDVYIDFLYRHIVTDVGSPNNITANDPSANRLRETWLISPGVQWHVSEAWTQSLYYSHSKQRQVAEKFPQSFGLDFGQNNRVQMDTDQLDYQSTIKPAEFLTLVAGATFLDQRYYRQIDVPNQFAFPATPTGTPDIQDTDTAASLFLNSQWQITRDWNYLVAVRGDHYSDNSFSNPITWRTGTSYRVPAVNTLLKGSYGTAFAPPTPQDLTPTFSGNPDLRPERSQGWELGFEQPMWSNRVQFGSTFFHNDLRDVIVLDASFVPQNIGNATTYGLENFVSFDPVKQLGFRLGHTWLEARDDDKDIRLVRRPRHQTSFDATYRPIEAVTITGGAVWVVDREEAAFPTTRDIEDYFIVRFTMSWKVNDNVQVFTRVENALNEQYEEVGGFPALDQAFYAGVKLTY